ncbi:MAG: YaiI/YqxD family protein [Planctomyces sp.]|nr:YaiI/YqxD family protein [Planctomyces sp.]
MKIWIDGDACPREAKELVYKTSQRLQLATTIVANCSMWIPGGNPLLKLVVVPGGPDVADRYIVEHSSPGDLAITSDVPLMSDVIAKGLFVIDFHGYFCTEDTVGERRAARDLNDQLRQSGLISGGPAPYAGKDKQRFAQALDQLLTRELKRLAKAAGLKGAPPGV